MLFSSELIQNKNYLKYRNLRAVVFTIFIFYCTPAYFILQNGESLAEDVQAMPWLKFYLIGVARNTNYHKEEEEMFKPYKANNWLHIQINSSHEIKLEFLINSESHNEKFEKMIKALKRQLGYKLIFKSI